MISNEAITQLICNCKNLHTLELGGYYMKSNCVSFLKKFNCCSSLEVLKSSIEISESGFESLSKVCHQLKIIELLPKSVKGIEKLLMTNRNLLILKIKSTSGDTKEGYVLEVLGLYCPLLQNCLLSYNSIISGVTVTQNFLPKDVNI